LRIGGLTAPEKGLEPKDPQIDKYLDGKNDSEEEIEALDVAEDL